MTKAPELLPCPFCGGEAENFSDYSCDCCGKPYNGNIQCKSCGAEVSHFDTDAEAISAWNTRTDHTLALLAVERGACAKICDEYYREVSSKETGPIMVELDAQSDYIERSIRARTNDDAQAALEARDARIRIEALEGVIELAVGLSKIESEHHDKGYSRGHNAACLGIAGAIEALITEGQNDE